MKKLNEESHAKPCAKELHAGRPMTRLKQQSNELPKLLPYFFPSTQSISKVVNTLKTVKPEKKKSNTIPQKMKSNAKNELKVEDERPSVEQVNKPLDLAFIGGAPFIHLAKSKKPKHRAEIFAISMQDIKNQLNKGTKLPTDPKTVVSAEYHGFLDVFSKEISDTLRPHRKHNHKIELLKEKNLSNLGHSAL